MVNEKFYKFESISKEKNIFGELIANQCFKNDAT